MRTKAFEIRDSATCIPVIATQLTSILPQESYLIARAGYQEYGFVPPAVMVTRLEDCHAANDSAEWGNRTMQVAHRVIEEKFNKLETGAVIDVQFILGETKQPKVTERERVPL